MPRVFYEYLGVVDVKSGHVADGEAVAGVDVREADGLAHDARQGCHIRDLLYTW